MNQLSFFDEESKRPANWPIPTPQPTGREFRQSRLYHDHMRSPAWRRTRAAKLELSGYRCEHCGATGRLDVHHKTYERFTRERPSDLEALCPGCHAKADREREQSADAARYNGGRFTFIDKVYGGYASPDAEQAWDEWKARQDEAEAYGGG